MTEFITAFGLAFLFFITAVFLMAVGAIFKKTILQGSCGGLGKILGTKCFFCTKKHKCPKSPEL